MMKPVAKGGKKKPAGKRAVRKAGPVQTPGQRWGQRLLVGLAVLVIAASMTREPKRATFSEENMRSIIAREDLRAAFSFESIDLQKTSAAQAEAEKTVPSYHRVDTERVQQQLAHLNGRIGKLREQREPVRAVVLEALKGSTSEQTAEEVVSAAVTSFASTLRAGNEWEVMPDADMMAIWLTPDLDSLPERVFEEAAGEGEDDEAAPRTVVALNPEDPGAFRFSTADDLAELTRQSLQYILTSGIRMDGLTATGESKAAVLRDVPVEDLPSMTTLETLADVPTPDEATEQLRERLREQARRFFGSEEDDASWARLHQAAMAMATPLLVDTLRRDLVATEDARQRARRDVEPVMRTIEAGETIQEGGKRWTSQSQEDARRYAEMLQGDDKPWQRVLTSGIGHLLLACLVLLCLRQSMGLLDRGMNARELKQFNLALLLICSALIVGRVALYFQPSGFILPLAAAGILYAILVNGRMAALVSALIVVLVSAQYSYDWRLLVVQGAMAVTGVFSIYKVRRRSDMAGASIKATIAGVVTMIAITFAVDSIASNTVLQRGALILLNGGLCLLVVPALLSPLERLFGITTDIQLLEYSDLNNELLSRLAIEVPGTYSHSLILGQLAEAAADAIGANGLLARVSAYYHDIGKMRRPEYFIENQTGVNIHDELSPRLSARAIAAHVIQGAEMAREYHLPKPIVDGILEHHGTCLIGFFYGQAQKSQKHGDVREADFRYPGPKPQSPETAILMICDASESGVRSLKNPNYDRVREFVDKIIAARLADRQFDECDLTMRQLDTIAEVVSRRIVSNLHGRISYPEPLKEEDTDRDNIIPMSASQSGTTP